MIDSIKNLLGGILKDVDQSYSSKRVITMFGMVCMMVGYFANLFWGFVVEEFMFSSMMYIVVGGLGIVGLEKFTPNKQPNIDPSLAKEENHVSSVASKGRPYKR